VILHFVFLLFHSPVIFTDFSNSARYQHKNTWTVKSVELLS